MKDIYERLKSYEPLFGEYELVEFTGGGSYGWVYKVRQMSRPSSFAALKVIPIPTNAQELHILEEKYPQKDLLQEKIHQIMTKQIEEINALEMFEGNTHIVSYKLSSVKRHEDGLGFDILILMEYLQSLTQYLRENEIREADVIRLGMDLCSALEIMRKKNMLHRDIKPQNIFYNEISGFKLGDFGISHSSMRDFYSSTAGTRVYAAPEIIKAEKIEAGDNRSDIYSLGLIMYQLLNDYKLPFITDECNPGEAFERRLSNEPYPKLNNVNLKLSAIVEKACAFNKCDRYHNETDMRKELEILWNNIQNSGKSELAVRNSSGIKADGGVNVRFYGIRRILLAVGVCAGIFLTLITTFRANRLISADTGNLANADTPAVVPTVALGVPSVTQMPTGNAPTPTVVIFTPTMVPDNTPASPVSSDTPAPAVPTGTPAPTAGVYSPTHGEPARTPTPRVHINSPTPKIPTKTPRPVYTNTPSATVTPDVTPTAAGGSQTTTNTDTSSTVTGNSSTTADTNTSATGSVTSVSPTPEISGGALTPSVSGSTPTPEIPGGTLTPPASGETPAPLISGGTLTPSAAGGTPMPSTAGGMPTPGGTPMPSATGSTPTPLVTASPVSIPIIGDSPTLSTTAGFPATSAAAGTPAPADTLAASTVTGNASTPAAAVTTPAAMTPDPAPSPVNFSSSSTTTAPGFIPEISE